MLFSPEQIHELLEIVSRYTTYYIAQNVGTEVLSETDKRVLLSSGIDLNLLGSGDSLVEQAFKFGIISDAIGHSAASKMKYDEFKRFVRSGKFIPLTKREKFVLQSIKTQSLGDIKGLGGKIQQDVSTILVDNSKKIRNSYEETIREEAVNAIENHKTARQMSLEIGRRTKNWGRDFDRISDFVMHQAFDEGRVASIQDEHGDDSSVYKDVYNGACKYCIQLYLTAGIGSKPKVFKASVLINNGTNIGRKVKDYKPVIGATHPYCRCTINHLPDDYIWSDEEKKFIPNKNFERKVQRKSKVDVKFGDKEYTI